MKTYTMEDWQKDRTFKAAIGQNVSDEVYYQMLNSVPPVYMGCGFTQIGEPYSHELKTGQPLYITFCGRKYLGLRKDFNTFGIH